jgi:hypothetical protein
MKKTDSKRNISVSGSLTKYNPRQDKERVKIIKRMFCSIHGKLFLKISGGPLNTVRLQGVSVIRRGIANLTEKSVDRRKKERKKEIKKEGRRELWKWETK